MSNDKVREFSLGMKGLPKLLPRLQEIEKAAFSLIELSIVIVIMGLLLAGGMAGREIINISTLKSVISEVESYKIAIDNFQTQYEALPGDMQNASSFWGSAAKNGNGDGKIGNGSSSDYTEPYYLWNHLTLSQFVPGTFSGNSSSGARVGVNVPESKYMDRVGFLINYATPWNYKDALNRDFSANYILIGRNHSATSILTDAFKPEDAYYIDSKIDNGKPDSGKVLAAGIGTCTTGTSPNISYSFVTKTISCFLAVSLK